MIYRSLFDVKFDFGTGENKANLFENTSTKTNLRGNTTTGTNSSSNISTSTNLFGAASTGTKSLATATTRSNIFGTPTTGTPLFGNTPFVFTLSENTDFVFLDESWTTLKSCVWQAPEWYNGRKRISMEPKYQNLGYLFKNVLKVLNEPTPALYLDYVTYIRDTMVGTKEKWYIQVKLKHTYAALDALAKNNIPLGEEIK
jgi:hypothetical protein